MVLVLPAAVAMAAPTVGFNIAGDVYTDISGSTQIFFTVTPDGDPVVAGNVKCKLDSDPFGSCSSYNTGTGAGRFGKILSPGDHVVTVQVTDDGGDVVTASQNWFVQRSLQDGLIDFNIVPSTTRAGRHPDLLIDIRNTAGLDVKNVSTVMPKGFAGSLAAIGASPRCDFPTAGLIDTTAIDPVSNTVNPKSELDAWCDEATRDASVVGNALVEAKIDDSTTRLRGKVVLTKGEVLGEAAGIAVIVPAKVSNLDLGNVLIAMHATVRMGSNPVDIFRNPEGINVTVSDLPRALTSVHGVTSFTMLRSRIWLTSDLDGPNAPLITNPSKCAVNTFNTTMTTWEGSTHMERPSFVTTGCDSQPYGGTVTTSFIEPINPISPTPDVPVPLSGPPNADQLVGLSTTLTMDANSTSTNLARIDLPPAIVPNYPGVAVECPNDATGVQANPPNCNDADTKLGTFTATSPLLDRTLTGKVYLVDSGSPLPWIYLFARDAELGIEVRLRGKAVAYNDPYSHVRVTLNTTSSGGSADLPDFPVSSVVMHMPGALNQGAPLKISNAYDICSQRDAGAYRLESHTGKVVVGMLPIEIGGTGCTQNLEFTSTTGFTGGAPNGNGGTTSDSTPAFNFEVGPANGFTIETSLMDPTFECSLDSPAGVAGTGTNPDYQLATSPFTFSAGGDCPGDGLSGAYQVSTPLRDGVHVLAIRATFDVYGDCDNNAGTPDEICTLVQRRHVKFRVATAGSGDATPPAVSVDSGPAGLTNDRTPTFTFTSDDPATDFSCRIRAVEAFEPCGTGSGSGAFTPDADLLNGDYSFEVRGEDAVGNVGNVVGRSFEIDPPFGPSFAITPSTNVARAHPTLKVELSSESDEDLRSIRFDMPKGFVGSLLGAAERCSAAAAASVNCPAASKVGTIDAKAQVDESEVVQYGEVFLTDPLVDGDPAGILAKVDPSVGAIDADNVNPIGVRARLVVRGNAEGVNVVPLDDVPREIEVHSMSPATSATVAFHFREMTLNLTGGAGASQPLLTNPSDCSASAFDATFKSWGSSTTNGSQPFQATNCDALPFYVGFASNVTSLANGGVPSPGENTRFAGTVATSPDDAGIRHSRIELPRSLSADPSGLPLGCSFEVYQATKTCDKGESAVIGSAVVNTPLLPGPLYGKIYLGQPDPNGYVDEPIYSETLRLIVQMRGLVSIDLVGRTILKDYRSVSVFENVPDAPVNSFSVVIDKLVRVRPTACSTYKNDRTITGVTTAQNGKTSPLGNDVNIACRGSISKTRVSLGGKGKRGKANVTAVAADGARFKTLNVTFPKGVKLVKRQLKKKLVVIADGKRVRKPCFKVTPRVLKLKMCRGKTSARTLRLTFRLGALRILKKPEKPKVKITATFDSGQSDKRVVTLRR